MKQWVEVESSGSCCSRPWSKKSRVESGVWHRVEGKGPRMDRRGRNDMDRMAGKKGSRVARDDGVSEVG